MKERRVKLVNLGCPKNLVDSEIIASSLKKAGFILSPDSEDADVVIINTCGFIKGAVDEAKAYIEEFIRKKEEGKISRLIVAGCLPQRLKERLSLFYPQVDIFAGVNEVFNFPEIISDTGKKFYLSAEPVHYGEIEREPSTYPYVYLKISEGCSKRCSFCTIPFIRGPYRSRRIEEIKKECHFLAERGYKEVILISQDTTFYGKDLYGKPSLKSLLESLEEIKGLRWIRLLYCYPRYFDDELINFIKDSEKVVKYIDLPIQHISEKILKRMRRGTSPAYLKRLIERLRKEVKNCFLRTSVIVGFPGESRRDFMELVNFLQDYPFDYLGVFPYSDEEGTGAFRMRGKLKQEEIEERASCLLELQRKISRKLNEKRTGRMFEAIVDGKHPEHEEVFIGRIYGQAPEIDGITYIRKKGLRQGDFINLKIVQAFDYDLEGVPV